MGDVDAALATTSAENRPALLAPLRDTLRQLPDDAAPAMPLRVWVALVNWVFDCNSPAWQTQDQAAVMTPSEFSNVATPLGATLGTFCFDLACNWADWPEGYFHDGGPGDDLADELADWTADDLAMP